MPQTAQLPWRATELAVETESYVWARLDSLWGLYGDEYAIETAKEHLAGLTTSTATTTTNEEQQ